MDSDRRRFGLAVALVLLASLAVPSAALGQNPPEPQVISALGVAQVAGRTTFVDVWVVVPAGADPQAAARDALERLGARPFNPAALGSTGFTLDGLVWPNNGASLTSAVTQNYNPANDPFVSAANPSGAQGDLTASEAAWGNVSMTVSGTYNNPTSFFSMGFGGTTNRCPSLVAECPGAQFLDGFEDVGWLQLQPGVLGVTWFTTSPPEADMALSTAFTWNTGCTNISGSFDVQTVFLHENGHLVGLGHSKDQSATMYPFYHGAQCFLTQDDNEGVTYLYPTNRAAIQGRVTDAATGAGINGAKVSLAGTSFSTKTLTDGTYVISGVAYPVTYDITASRRRYISATVRVQIPASPTIQDFALSRR